MSEQEMQFASPDWQPNSAGVIPQQAAPQPVNEPLLMHAAPSQADDISERGYAGGYAGVEFHEPVVEDQSARGYAGKAGRPAQGWKLARAQRRRRSPWLWIVIAAIAVMLVGGLAQGYFSQVDIGSPDFGKIVSQVPREFNKSFSDSRTFDVSANSTVTVNDPLGSILVTSGGSSNVVSVQTSAGTFDRRDGSPAQMNQDASGNVLIDVGNNASDPFGSVDVQLVVPEGINLVLQTTSGDIAVNNVSGQFTLNSDSGSIALNDVTLAQNSSIQTNSGDIDFSGSLQPLGTYQISSQSGAITAEMQGSGGQSYPFHLHATTGGQLTINDQVPASSANNTFDLNRDFGTNPKATLTLQSQTGDITLQSQ